MSANFNPDPVKVVIVHTQYVETDPMSFKSVVQSLTGKHCSTAKKPPRSDYSAAQVSTAAPVLSRGMSFKDLERMLVELPPLDEMYRQLYAE